jgi:glycosyltransferase involved in cell wall biosynthesis
MRIRYFFSAHNNSLYEGKFQLFSRYKTFGQHSYIYDFARCAHRLGIELQLVLDNCERFPLVVPLKQYCKVTDVARQHELPSPVNAAILDTVDEAMLPYVPANAPAFLVVHKARESFPDSLLQRTSGLVCMTPNAVAIQNGMHKGARTALIPQGVDLKRFHPNAQPKLRTDLPEVLWYTRLSPGKEDVLMKALAALIRSPCRVTILGDGEVFWQLSDRFGESACLVNFAPCHSIHNFISRFDVVVSSGRGVMEALACGIPVLCAGFGYAGLVTPSNVAGLVRYNLTGWLLEGGFERLPADLERAVGYPPSVCRSIAEEYFCGEKMVSQWVKLIESSQSARR